MDMNKYRREFAQDAELEIKQLETYNTQDTATIGRFRNDKGLEYKVAELRAKIEKRKGAIEELTAYISQLKSGEADDKIRAILDESKRKQESTTRTTLSVKRAKSRVTAEHKSTGFKYGDSERSDMRKNDYNYAYRYYLKITSNLRDDFVERIESMPNNKGRVFRDVWYFGKRPDDGTSFSVSNKVGDTIVVTEWNELETRVFNKVGDKKMKLVSTKKRRNVFEL